MNPSAASVEAALADLFPSGVCVAAEPIVPAQPEELWPEERPALLGAVPTRLADFAAGRRAARRALQRLGRPIQPLPMGPDRAPLWPAGISGSIAHAAGLAVAVARTGAPLGIDIEPDAPITPDLWDIICVPQDLERLAQDDIGRGVRHIFCAKEAVFKAQPAGERTLFGHESLSVTLAETVFHAQFLTHAGKFRAGQTVHGRITLVDGVVLAGVAV